MAKCKPLTKEQRNELIEKLVDVEADTIRQMVLSDPDSLREYIKEALGHELGMPIERCADQGLEDIYYSRLGQSYQEEA